MCPGKGRRKEEVWRELSRGRGWRKGEVGGAREVVKWRKRLCVLKREVLYGKVEELL